jgi:hypothetical protein
MMPVLQQELAHQQPLDRLKTTNKGLADHLLLPSPPRTPVDGPQDAP